ncbi:M48 family metallopeptidase [Streptomyces sp. NPDC091292]|uniref:M48 family metallopeptidase n=1 Tax=Streptomyces sp. NPDC091292 TaxID=3365991 RepID=UPI00382A6E0A
MDPSPQDPAPGRVEAVRRRLAHRHGEHLLAEMETSPDPRPRRDTAGVVAYGIALAVHLVTVVLAVAGVLLVVLGWSTVVRPLVGAVLLIVAFALRPRFGRLPDDTPVLSRAEAPRLFALIDEVAAVAGTRGVDAVAVGSEFNASVTTYGLRQRRVLRVGLGLWEVMSWEQRVAVLGHEVGHYAHGDTRHQRVIGGALRSLALWLHMLSPIESPSLVERFANALMFLPRCAVRGVLLLLDHLTMRASQRAEYLADRTAARAGSTAAATELMDVLLLGSAVGTELRRASVAAQTRGVSGGRTEVADGLWERLAAHTASVPEREYERLRRVAALRGHSVDATHPPTHLRRRCLADGEQSAALITVDRAMADAVAGELAAARAKLARQVVRDYAG